MIFSCMCIFAFLLCSVQTQHECFQNKKEILIESSVSGSNDVLIELDTSSWGISSSCSDINFFLGGVNKEFWVQNGACGVKNNYFWLNLALKVGNNSLEVYYVCPSGENPSMINDAEVQYFFFTLNECDAYPNYEEISLSVLSDLTKKRLIRAGDAFSGHDGSSAHNHGNVALTISNEIDPVEYQNVENSDGNLISFSHSHTINTFSTNYEYDVFPHYYGVNICSSSISIGVELKFEESVLIPFSSNYEPKGFYDVDSEMENRYLLFSKNQIGLSGGGSHSHSYVEETVISSSEEKKCSSLTSGIEKTSNQHTHILNGTTDLTYHEEESDPPAINFKFMHSSNSDFIIRDDMVLFVGGIIPPLGWSLKLDYCTYFIRHSTEDAGSLYGCTLTYPSACTHTHTIGNETDSFLDPTTLDPIYCDSSETFSDTLPSNEHYHQAEGTMDSTYIDYPFLWLRPYVMKDQSNWVVYTEIICDAGSFLNGSTCEYCPIGYYREEESSQDNCTKCPGESSTETVGSNQLSLCSCKKGFGGNDQTSCVECPKNTYKNFFGFGNCTGCTDNSITLISGSSNESDCLCEEGYEKNLLECTKCPSTKYKENIGNYECQDCGDNEMSTPNRTSCACNFGYYLDSETSSCTKCIQGTYKSSISNDNSCIPCLDGFTTFSEGSTNTSDCVCLPGHELSDDECVLCSSTKYKEEIGNNACEDCGENKASITNRTSCACDIGYYFNFETSICTECKQGSYKSTISNDECISCVDEFSTTKSNGSTSVIDCECIPGYELIDSECSPCSSLKYKDQIGNNACEYCENNKVSILNRTSCACDLGYHFDENICIECEKGSYKSSVSDNSCISCMEGYTTFSEGSTNISDCVCSPGYGLSDDQCIMCSSTKYKDQIGNYECEDCGENKVSILNRTYCACNIGYYYDSEISVCTECIQGSYKSTISDDACILCVDGYNTILNGSTNITDCVCSIGYELSFDECEECKDGYYKDSIGNLNCSACSDGYLCPSKIEGKEEFCIVGHYCTGGVAQPCIAGYYNNITNAPVSECEECPRNYYCAEEETITPEECDLSYYCPPGTDKPVPCECNVHGDCINSVTDCHCWTNYSSEDCSVFDCWGEEPSGKERDEICNNGYCYGANICLCEDGWRGTRCNTFTCLGILPWNESVCNASGWCVSLNTCECFSGYTGEWCSIHDEDYSDDEAVFSEVLMIVIIVCASFLVVSVLLILAISFFCCAYICLKKKRKIQNDSESIELNETPTSQASFNLHKKFFSVDQKEVKIIKELGKGAYGSVFLAEWEGKSVAIKMFKTSELTDSGKENDFSEFEKELEIIASVSHPNVLYFYGCCLKPPRVGVVLEYCDNGDLQDFIEKNPESLTNKEKIQILNGVSSAMSYLHHRSIIHRDIKSKNILLTKDFEAKVCDFGIARVVEKNNKSMTTRVGTRIYMAPEVLTSKSYNEKCDVYSFSIVMWELLHEDFEPFKEIEKEDNSNLNVEYKVVVDHEFRPIISKEVTLKYDPSILNMMKNCWSHDPKKRPSFGVILEILKVNIKMGKE